jgi:serine phosphatase RsbU (regulator of sigma subunit)
MGFEPMFSMFEQVNIVCVLYRASTVIGAYYDVCTTNKTGFSFDDCIY